MDYLIEYPMVQTMAYRMFQITLHVNLLGIKTKN